MADPKPPSSLNVTTCEMHTGGEALRVIESGYPEPQGQTVLQKRAWLRDHADQYRKMLMWEPRGHYDMYGALLVPPDLPGCQAAAIFMHNEGYSTMCGHAVIALGRYLVDKGVVAATPPETRLTIQCPCGPVTAYVTHSDGKTADVSFSSVPSYVYALDVEVDVPEVGRVRVDVAYGGAFYGLVPAQRLGLDLDNDPTAKVADLAFAVTKALQKACPVHHPDDADLAFIYGTIVTDGGDHANAHTPTNNICVFADKEVDRSPCGSGVSARVAVQRARGLLGLGKTRCFKSGVTGSEFRAGPEKDVQVVGAARGGADAAGVVARVAGRAFYTGSAAFTLEQGDPLAGGFLPK